MNGRRLFLAAMGLGLSGGSACTRKQVSVAPSAQDAYRQPLRVLAALALRPGDHVAEIGAGGGYLTRYLSSAVGPSGRIVATDIDDEALAALALRCRHEGLQNVLPRRVAAADPGLETAAFDLIVLCHVDHLLLDRAAYLRQLPAALKPGRRSRIVVSNREAHRAALLAAAVDAGLRIEPPSPPPDLPGQYLVTLRPALP